MATAGEGGKPRLIAVSFVWDGDHLLITTRVGTPTATNLDRSGLARLALGSQDDVIMIDASVIEKTPVSEARPALKKVFIQGAGWDPGEEGADWAFFRLRPVQIEAYRGYGELEGRVVMRDSGWLA